MSGIPKRLEWSIQLELDDPVGNVPRNYSPPTFLCVNMGNRALAQV